MTKKETGEFLFRYYQKRVASFLASLYKASITCDDKDIHKARVDVKKIFAMFYLFEMVLPRLFKKEEHYPTLKEIFDHSGKIREIQINLGLLEKYSEVGPDMVLFREFLVNEENKQTRIFIAGIKKFDEKTLKQTGKAIKSITRGISRKKFLADAGIFIRSRTKRVAKYLKKENSPENIHKIRRHLKSMIAIANLSLTLKPDERLKLLIKNMDQAEGIIGEWHDKIVLLESIGHFRSDTGMKKKELLQKIPAPLMDMEARIQEDCSGFMEQIKPATEKVVTEVISYYAGSEPDEKK